jgi:ABC-type Fe3+ transport system permease subunit
MFATYGYPTVRRPINTYQITTPLDIAWKVTWPLLVTNIIAGAMVICFIIIAALEVASLAKSTSKSQYGNTSSTGAGFWCGIFFLIAAVLIFLMSKEYKYVYLKVDN